MTAPYFSNPLDDAVAFGWGTERFMLYLPSYTRSVDLDIRYPADEGTIRIYDDKGRMYARDCWTYEPNLDYDPLHPLGDWNNDGTIYGYNLSTLSGTFSSADVGKTVLILFAPGVLGYPYARRFKRTVLAILSPTAIYYSGAMISNYYNTACTWSLQDAEAVPAGTIHLTDFSPSGSYAFTPLNFGTAGVSQDSFGYSKSWDCTGNPGYVGWPDGYTVSWGTEGHGFASTSTPGYSINKASPHWAYGPTVINAQGQTIASVYWSNGRGEPFTSITVSGRVRVQIDGRSDDPWVTGDWVGVIQVPVVFQVFDFTSDPDVDGWHILGGETVLQQNCIAGEAAGIHGGLFDYGGWDFPSPFYDFSFTYKPKSVHFQWGVWCPGMWPAFYSLGRAAARGFFMPESASIYVEFQNLTYTAPGYPLGQHVDVVYRAVSTPQGRDKTTVRDHTLSVRNDGIRTFDIFGR